MRDDEERSGGSSQGYTEYLTEFAQADGVEAPTREELAASTAV